MATVGYDTYIDLPEFHQYQHQLTWIQTATTEHNFCLAAEHSLKWEVD